MQRASIGRPLRKSSPHFSGTLLWRVLHPANAALVHVKKEVFGVEGGKAIMNDDHPAIKEMLGLPKGDHCFN